MNQLHQPTSRASPAVPCAKWVDGATPHPFPPDDPTAANAHAAPTHIALLLPCGVLTCRLVGASPPPRPRFHQICSPPSRLFGVMMHCDASLSLPRSGSRLWLLSRHRLPSAPVCSRALPMLLFLFPLASPPPSSLSDRYPPDILVPRQPPSRQHANMVTRPCPAMVPYPCYVDCPAMDAQRRLIRDS